MSTSRKGMGAALALRRAHVLAALVWTGCMGSVGEVVAPPEQPPAIQAGAPAAPAPGSPAPNPTPAGGADATPAVPLPGHPVFRRLTRSQYGNSLRALLGDVALSADLSEALVPGQDQYTTVASGIVTFTATDAQALYDGATAAADQVFSDAKRRAALVGCEPAAANDPCALGFLRRFATRAFRRPVTDAELQRWAGVTQSVTSGLQGDVWAGIRHAVSGILQSPKFLYLEERGQPVPGRPDRLAYTSWEMAARLAYALVDGPPDDALLDAAGRGLLVDATAVRAQAERLLATDRGRAGMVSGFLAAYFEIEDVGALRKNAAIFPQWSAALAGAMREEARRDLETAAVAENLPIGAWLTRPKTFLDSALATFYGVAVPASAGFTEMIIPADDPRVGLLGTGAFLASQARYDRTSPTVRGKFISSRMLCRSVPPPPPNANTQLPPPGPATVTVRQRLESHRSDPACAGCHAALDPLGLMLEGFDAIGAHRTSEGGQAIDVSGAVDGKPVSGLRGLAGALAESAELPRCLARNAFRYLTGTVEDDGQAQELAAIGRRTEGKLGSLLVSLVTSDFFRFMAVPNVDVRSTAAGGQP